MPRPYSYDWRVRVVAAVEKGMEVREASRTFGGHRDTIRRWLACKEATGDVEAKSGYQRGHSHKITNPEQFQAFLQQPGDAPLEGLAAAWGGGKRRTLWRQLRKLGYTHKKRPSAMLNATTP